MDETTLLFPIRPEMASELKQFASRLAGADAERFDGAQRQLGISRESWFLHETPQGMLVVVHVEGKDLPQALANLAASDDPFDRRLKEEVRRLTGIDIGAGPTIRLPQTLLRYRA